MAPKIGAKSNYTVTSKYVDKKVKAGHTYYYSIKAVGKNGIDSSDGSTVSAYVPKKIKKFKSVKKNNLVTLKWSKDKSASGYVVYMSNKKNGKYKVVKTIKSATKSKFKVPAGTKGYFKVRAYYSLTKKKLYGKFSKKITVK